MIHKNSAARGSKPSPGAARTRAAFLAAAALALQAAAAHAGSATFLNTGAIANFTDGGNWFGGVAPGNPSAPISGTNANPDIATFDSIPGSIGGSSSIPLVINSTTENLAGLTFTINAGAFFIGTAAANPLYLTSGGVIQITGGNAVQNINAPIVIEGTPGGAAYSFINNGVSGATTSAALNFGGNISGGAPGSALLTLAGAIASNNNITGIIANGNATSLSILKAGPIFWTLSAANTYTGTTTLTGGILTISGLTGSINQSSAISATGIGTLLNVSYLTGNAVDRIKNSATVTLGTGAEYKMSMNTTAATITSETIGALTIDTGNSTLTLNGDSTGVLDTLAVSPTGFSRLNSATALIRGTNLGTALTTATLLSINGTTGTGLSLVGTTTSTTGPAVTGTLVNLTIVPYLLGDTSATGVGANFLTYDQNANHPGLRLLDSGEQVALASATANSNVMFSGGTSTGVATKTFNSLLLNGAAAGTITGAASTTLTLTSGALADVATGSSPMTLNGFTSIIFGGTAPNANIVNDAIITNVNTAAPLKISSPIDTASPGGKLITAGAGTIILNANNLYTGPTIINQGTLQIGDGLAGSINSNAITITPQGTLTIAIADGTAMSNSILNNGAINKLAANTRNELSGSISGTGSLTINTPATNDVLNFSTLAKSYSGPTTLIDGALQATNDVLSPNSPITFAPSSTTSNPTLNLHAETSTTFHNGGVTFTGSTGPGQKTRQMSINVDDIGAGNGQTLTLAGTFTINGYAAVPTVNVSGGNQYTLHLTNIDLQPAAAGAGVLPVIDTTVAASLLIDNVTVGTNGAPSTGLSFADTGKVTLAGNLIRAANTDTFTITQNGTGILTLAGSASTTAVNVAGGPAGYVFNLVTGKININSNTALGTTAGADGLLAGEGFYFRTLNISGGQLDNSSGAPVTEIANPNINLLGDFVFIASNALNLGAGAVVLNGPTGFRTINVNGAQPLTFAGAMSAGTSFGFDKEGPGTLILSGPNTVTAAAVGAGTLIVNSTFAAPGLSLNGGTVGGGGTFAGNIFASGGAGTVFPSATLSPTSTTTLTAQGVSTGPTTTLEFNLVTPNVAHGSDQLILTGNGSTTLSGGTIVIANTSTGAASLGYYKLIQYTGPLEGDGAASLTLPTAPAGTKVVYTLDLLRDPGFIDLHRGFSGDANDDGLVNFSDFVLLSNHFGKPNQGWGGGDFNGDGITNFSDFVLLSNNFGKTIDGASELSQAEIAAFQSETATFGNPTPVPEPASLALLTLGAAILLRRRVRSTTFRL